MKRSISALLIVMMLWASPSLAQEAYVLGPGDVLDIQVWDNKDLSQTGFIAPDGRISLPVIGQIQAGGKTIQQLQDQLTKEYSKTVKIPLVAVILKEINSRPVHLVSGFVKTGTVQLNRSMRLLEIIPLGGGITPVGDAERGFIVRGNQKIPVNVDKLLRGDLSQNVPLAPFDSIVIPTAEMVYVQGEVRTPGAIKYTSQLTLSKAVTLAGGTTNMGAPGRTDLHRVGDKTTRVDLDRILRDPASNPDVPLRPGDLIYIPQRLF